MARASVRDIDRGWARHGRKIKRAAREKRSVLVGLLTDGQQNLGTGGGSADDAAKGAPGMTIVQVGTFNEFGFGVPKRSFIRDGFDRSLRSIEALGKRLAVGVYSDKITAEQWLLAIGSKARSSFVARINKGIPPPNEPSTIAAKGSSRTLVDTGQLKGSITYSLRRFVV